MEGGNDILEMNETNSANSNYLRLNKHKGRYFSEKFVTLTTQHMLCCHTKIQNKFFEK
jgi:hypothetical protein